MVASKNKNKTRKNNKKTRVLGDVTPLGCLPFVGLRQVYPEGNQSNNNQFMAAATGTVSAVDGLKAVRGPGKRLLYVFFWIFILMSMM